MNKRKSSALRTARTVSFAAILMLCLNPSRPAQAAQEPAAPPAQAAQPQDQSPQTAEAPLIPPKEHSVLGELEIVTFNSKTFRNIRNLRVWLPGNYFAPVNRNKHYPVLYMQDGQNLEFTESRAALPNVLRK